MKNILHMQAKTEQHQCIYLNSDGGHYDNSILLFTCDNRHFNNSYLIYNKGIRN